MKENSKSENVLHSIGVCYRRFEIVFSERNIIIYNCITVKENTNTGSYFIREINE